MAARWGWIPFNPALMVRPAGGKGKARPVPTPNQVRERKDLVILAEPTGTGSS
jgi:hypothetical protein